MRLNLKKRLSVLLVILLGFGQAFSAIDDQKDLAALADNFAIAMAKKDKAWMEANLSDGCVMQLPSGDSVNKNFAVKAFTGELYEISKASASNKSFMVAGSNAGGSADFTVEGVGKMGGQAQDITGTYNLSLKFKKSDKGWQISEILVNAG
jgi:hypothetical protein